MNVVGRVGNLITQGVYTVATPFHPFGGAVDVIVVQQPDGTFRSNPWYVRFGKFQGVLKGFEKFVRIAVNGVEADFHMYLDNSGEAYFVKEVVPDDSDNNNNTNNNNNNNSAEFFSVNGDFGSSENVRRLEHSVSDSAVDELQEERASGLERAESDGERRFYEFQDDQSSLDDSVELSDYDGFEGENVAESQDLDSEVVLVSVDGHILTAPITAAEKNKFGSGEKGWAVDYISKVNGGNTVKGARGEIASGHELEVCEGDGEHHSCEATESLDIRVHSDSEDIAVEDTGLEDLSLSLEAHCKAEDVGEVSENEDRLSPLSGFVSLDNGIISMDLQRNDDEENGDVAVSNGFDNYGGNSHDVVNENSEREEDERFEFGVSESPVASEVSMAKEKEEEGTVTTSHTHSNTGFEISLCGNKLQPGMGSDAASEAFDASHVSPEDFKASAASILKNGNLVVRYRGQYFPWEKAAHIALGIAAFGLDDLSVETEHKDAIPVELSSKNNESGPLASTPSGRRWRIWSIPFRRVKTLEHAESNLSNDDEFVDSESVLAGSQVETPTSQNQGRNDESPRKQLVRTNVPSSQQIASLNLKDGQNIVTFSFSTRVLGRQQVEAHMYLWKWNARIVISDVDGTITKSDVLGQFMPLVGKDWSQSGVAKLFSAIKENGYQLLFLSARAIVQAYLTRSFLLNLKQDGSSLPDGPVVISPDGLFPSLYREVIRRAPHEFKIACLEDIKKLFPSDYNPFYAGFGNRDTDELSYRKIGIPKGKIFIINPKGEVAISHRIDVKSYTSLHTLVNDMFPPTSLVEQVEDYNSWNFWKVPLPEVEE